jgi:hypothetical protein
VGVAWIFSAENFMKQFSFLSFGKLRGSYGVTGSDQVGDFQYISTYKFLENNYDGKISLTPNGLANRDYAWESTYKLEASLELGLLRNRIRTEVNFYRNRCSNQLLEYPLPGFSGFSGVTQNLQATVQNTGWEVSVNTVNIDGAKFQWTSAFNITFPRNKLIAYPGLEESSFADNYIVGQSVTTHKAYHYLGVNPTTGLYEVKDVDGNGAFDLKDMIAILSVARHAYGGLMNSFRFKNMECSFLLQFVQLTDANYVQFPLLLGEAKNIPLSVYNARWKKDGDLAQVRKAMVHSSNSNSVYEGDFRALGSDAIASNISFLRVKTFSLSYALPPSLLARLRTTACKLYVQGQNLFTLSNTLNLDPETGSGLPPLRMLTFGIDVNF